MIILVDTREQLPYWFGCNCARIKLDVGDYTTVEKFNRLHIERKSAIDWYGTLTNGFQRFRKELLRAIATKTRLIVLVELTEARFYAKDFPRGKLLKGSGDARKAQIRTLRRKYGLEVVWAKDRLNAKKICHELLLSNR